MNKFDEATDYAIKVPGAFQWLSMKHMWDAALPYKHLVELGVDQGKSASILMHLARMTGAKVTLIDLWPSILRDNYYKVLDRVEKDFSDIDVTVIWGPSAEQDVGPFDFIHIDADHENSSKHPGSGIDLDCQVWLPRLAPGGTACFHDYGSSWVDVKPAVDTYTKGWEDLGVWEGLAIRRKP